VYESLCGLSIPAIPALTKYSPPQLRRRIATDPSPLAALRLLDDEKASPASARLASGAPRRRNVTVLSVASTKGNRSTRHSRAGSAGFQPARGGRSPPHDAKRRCVGLAHEPAGSRRSQRDRGPWYAQRSAHEPAGSRRSQRDITVGCFVFPLVTGADGDRVSASTWEGSRWRIKLRKFGELFLPPPKRRLTHSARSRADRRKRPAAPGSSTR